MVGRYYWYDDARARALGYSSTPTADAIADAVQWLVRTEHLHPLVRSGIHLDRLAHSNRD
jgi:dihydroflavonol-4-reductase